MGEAMVNLPVKLEVPDEPTRRALLRTLDVVRQLIEDGQPIYQFDTTEFGNDGARVDLAHFAFRPDDFSTRWEEVVRKLG